MNKIIDFIIKYKTRTQYLNAGRDIVLSEALDFIKENKDRELNILDVGMGDGEDLLNIKKHSNGINLHLYGADIRPIVLEEGALKGISVFTSIDIETMAIPVKDEFFDLVIMNQIIEHTKEIFWIFSEISRIIKEGGILIVGTPNLAAFHNRVLLLFGKQPSSIQLMSAHVRGFVEPEFKKFIGCGEYFKVKKIKGSNFYPFPPFLSKKLSKLFPTFSVCLFFIIERTTKKGVFLDNFKSASYMHQYFTCQNKVINK